ncbi:hypothetical protein AWH56_021125 [Anaerobacillus isosaccharinicus]|uniref:Uncharacterized protein n=1 Tax=Anaerobacillus isosaccharinicus TaxID=1532552 RepID=A0A1S2LKE5_9BACI|nr:hypothetical protein [Anaerobacillus isosaccharinicus]MBA5586588.1 hypothetical protein [Anaerobacillus isosaccharinicus]QOY35176.1 hypothetical protein AWH56_021125 [Anaerobacillus isosaccharinicus]
MSTKSSTQSFLANLIDYAGLFPPSQLPLEEAINNYVAYQADHDSWMLGRFIIPATRLEELDPYMYSFSKNKPLPIAAIGQGSTDVESCLEALKLDLEKITTFCKKHGKAVSVDVLELPLPPVIPTSHFLNVIGSEARKHNLQIFCEMTMSLNSDWVDLMLSTLDEISEHNRLNETVLGMKLRTGGITADAFPTPTQVATVLVGCYERKIPLKFTAGLHHPIRMYRDEVKTKMHGFLNLFTAGMTARVHLLDIDTTAEILADEDASHFRFTSKGLCWRDLVVPLSEIEQLRKQALYSYGSCSFNEPREGLQLQKII